MDTAQAIATNGLIALVLLLFVTPVLAAVLIALWLGPARWPLPMCQVWENLPERWRKMLLLIAYAP